WWAEGERRAADAAGAGVQDGDAVENGGEGVGEPGVAGVVEVVPERRRFAHGLAGPGRGPPHLVGRADADGVAQAQLVEAGGRPLAGELDHPAGVHLALERAAE